MRTWLGFALLCCIFCSCTPRTQHLQTQIDQKTAEFPNPKTTSPHEDSRNAVEDNPTWNEGILAPRLRETMDLLQIPGMMLAVIRDGKVIVERFEGYTDFENSRILDRHLGTNANLNVGHLAETWAAYQVSEWVNSGYLAWDMPVTALMPGFRYTDITLAHVLSGTSGLASVGTANVWDMDTIQILQLAKSLERLHAPSTHDTPNDVLFSAVMYAAAAHVTGKNPEVVKDNVNVHVFRSIPNGESPTILPGHDWDMSQRLKVLPDMPMLQGVGGIATWPSLVDWVKAELERAESEACERWTAILKANDGRGNGLGYRIVDLGNGLHWIHQESTEFGYSASIGFIPERKFGYIIWANAKGEGQTASLLAHLILDIELGTSHWEKEKDAVKTILSQSVERRQRLLSRVEADDDATWGQPFWGEYRHDVLGHLHIEQESGEVRLRTDHWSAKLGRMKGMDGGISLIVMEPPLMGFVLHPTFKDGQVVDLSWSDPWRDYRFTRE